VPLAVIRHSPTWDRVGTQGGVFARFGFSVAAKRKHWMRTFYALVSAWETQNARSLAGGRARINVEGLLAGRPERWGESTPVRTGGSDRATLLRRRQGRGQPPHRPSTRDAPASMAAMVRSFSSLIIGIERAPLAASGIGIADGLGQGRSA